MLASVIIPIYKVEPYLKECVDSVLRQTYKDLEVILVDDGSPDMCPKICDEYAVQDARVTVIHQNHGGLSSARNTALDIMRGKYVFFVDSDDRIESTLVEHTISLMEKERLGAVYFEAHIMDEEGRIIGDRFHMYDKPTTIPSKKVLEMVLTNHIDSQVWKCAYRSEYWANIRFPVARVYEDTFTIHKVFAVMQTNVAFIQEKLYFYRLNSQGITLSSEYDSIRFGDLASGFVEKYNFAVSNCSQSIHEICMENAVVFGNISVWSPKEKRVQREVVCFLRKNILRILFSNKCQLKDKIKAVIICLSPTAAKHTAHVYRNIKHVARKCINLRS